MSKLFVVGTPIGNLGDLSQRAIEILNSVDFIAAEDTRVSVKLLNHFNIKKPIVSYHEHSSDEKEDFITSRILSGDTCALVSDAGMPVISDPGVRLIKECYNLSIPVESVPGPTALATALAISGIECKRFCFEGFLSVNKPSRKKHLDELKDEKRLMIFYEAPHKLPATLKDMYSVFGERNIVIVKELTKIHEKVIHTNFKDAIAMYEQTVPKGEYVLLIEGAGEENTQYALSDAVKAAKIDQSEGLSAAQAAKRAAKEFDFTRGEIYSLICK